MKFRRSSNQAAHRQACRLVRSTRLHTGALGRIQQHKRRAHSQQKGTKGEHRSSLIEDCRAADEGSREHKAETRCKCAAPRPIGAVRN